MPSSTAPRLTWWLWTSAGSCTTPASTWSSIPRGSSGRTSARACGRSSSRSRETSGTATCAPSHPSPWGTSQLPTFLSSGLRWWLPTSLAPSGRSGLPRGPRWTTSEKDSGKPSWSLEAAVKGAKCSGGSWGAIPLPNRCWLHTGCSPSSPSSRDRHLEPMQADKVTLGCVSEADLYS
uniref:Putative secreted protein n=1 Tax=Ixodes scapularis TaxID=6945 RepID=A0A4D5RAC6_IXOSC